jgi:hypothetical protein
MKILNILLIALAAATCAYAQTSSNGQSQQGILILKYNWDEYRRPRSLNLFPQASTANDSLSIPNSHVPDMVTEYAYKLTIKNVGAKTIEAVGWDYVFVDPITHKEMARHHFWNKEKIEPGDKSSLTGISISAPGKVVTVSALERDARNPYAEQIVISCIRYTDGSFWQKEPSDKNSCQQPDDKKR